MRLDLLRNRRRRRAGFSVVEAVIGMLVFGITAVALYGGLVSGYTTVRLARENQRATQIILDTMEMVRLYSWDQLNTPGFLPETFTVVDTGHGTATDEKKNSTETPSGITYTGKIAVADPPLSVNYGSRLKVVTVQLDWMTGGIQRTRSLSTLVANDGLYSYIY